MTVYSEEILPIPVGLGLDTYGHPANIPEGFVQQADNVIALQDRMETRKGFQPPDAVDTREVLYLLTPSRNFFYTEIPNAFIGKIPSAMWGDHAGNLWAMKGSSFFNPSSIDPTDPSIANFSTVSAFKGACVYLDKIYINTAGTIKEVTSAWNWATPTVTVVAITDAPSNTYGLFAFKDRLWTWDYNKIYYTDVPASPGAYPETWDTTGNFIHIGANAGSGEIYSIVPVGTKLFVFTATGLYTVSVIGSPANWIVRVLDKTVKCNQNNCALVSEGLMYFVDVTGVYVTDGSSVNLITKAIDNVFVEQSSYSYYSLHPFEDGMLLSKQNVSLTGTYPSSSNTVTSDAEIYFSRFDFIAWTKITFATTTQPSAILGAFSNINVYGISSVGNFIILGHGTSSAGTPGDITFQLLQYTGYQDELRPDGAAEQVADVTSIIKTKILRGEMFKLKRAKYAYLNVSCDGASLDAMEMTYAWNTETADSIASGTVTDGIVDPAEALFKISADFQWRHLELELSATLSSDVQQYSILGAGVINHTHRTTARKDS